MNTDSYQVNKGRTRVMAFHCSGSGPGQWTNFTETLGNDYHVLTPEHYGSVSIGPWTGEHAFSIADEAAKSLALIDESEGRVHLVGHSYGGGVALHIALTRPQKVASLALYEPSAFHLLRHVGDAGRAARAEIGDVAQRISHGVVSGDYRSAVAHFIDYWNGPGTWAAMRPSLQKNLIGWAPKGPLEFRALMDDTTPASAYGRLRVPVLILYGEHAPPPTRVIAQFLGDLLPISQSVVIPGAGHMGPLTHSSTVSAWIAEHIAWVDRAEAARLDVAGHCSQHILSAHFN